MELLRNGFESKSKLRGIWIISLFYRLENLVLLMWNNLGRFWSFLRIKLKLEIKVVRYVKFFSFGY